jgi:hypothetical protein
VNERGPYVTDAKAGTSSDKTGDGGRFLRLLPARQHRQNYIAAGDPRFQRLCAGRFDRRQALIEDGTQYFDELLIAVGMLLQLRSHLRQGGLCFGMEKGL